jgi:hypothetical protein
MPLSPPGPRRHRHTRRVHCEGFLRDDGLWEIEGHIVDTKPFAYRETFRGDMPAGRPVHDMWVRLTLDDDLVIHAVEAATDAAPYAPCHGVPPDFARLKGLRIGPGWRRKARQLLGGTQGCTHLLELLDPVATVAFQTISAGKWPGEGDADPYHADQTRRPFFLDGCRAWSTEGDLVRRLYPQFYRPAGATDET